MYIGVDIGGTKILVVGSADGETIEHHHKLPTPADGDDGIETVIELITAVAGGHHIEAIGVVAPNIHITTGIIMNPVNMPGWHGVPIKQRLAERFGVPIIVDNDANAGALGEAAYGAGRDYPTMLYVTWSTGIGTGLVLNGKLYHGANDTEGGHMLINPNPDAPICGCGVRGHWEAQVAGPAIRRDYGKEAWQLKEHKPWDTISLWFAIGLANLIHVYSPDVVVIGGGVGTHYDMYKAPLDTHLKKLVTLYPLPPVVIAKHMEEAAAYGALVLAKSTKK